jgi:hypothetical protein
MNLCSGESVCWQVRVTRFADKPELQWINSLTSLCCSESVRWWICVPVNQLRWQIHVTSFADEPTLQQISPWRVYALANQFADESMSLVSLTNLHCSKSVPWRVCVSANQFAHQVVVQRSGSLTSLCCSESVCWWIYVPTNQFADDSVSLVSLINLWCIEFVR